MPRFVVLRHELPGPQRAPVHWDFMLQEEERLRTWALAEQPDSGLEIAADALADHRLMYLYYEGPISDGRGEVERWDSGDYETVHETADELIVRLRGRRLNGVVRLRLPDAGSQRWMFDFSE